MKSTYLWPAFLFCCCLAFHSYAQRDTVTLTLPQLIQVAQSDAPDVQIARTTFNNNYWRYQSFLADYKPQIVLEATLPDVNRAIDPIVQPDGSVLFRDVANMRNNLGISIRQDVGLTGGTIFASTGLNRLDIFATEGREGKTSYLSTPISIGISQPVFTFNALRWNKRIQPLVFDEAKRIYSEDMEQVAFEGAVLFFDVLIAQYNLAAAQRDKADADTLYAISRGRFSVGRVAETELLQFELNARNADAELAQRTLDLQTSTEQLRDFLGIREAIFFRMEIPDDLPAISINPDTALAYARRYRSESVNFERRMVEARADVAEAKGASGLNMEVFASFGLQQSAESLSDAYTKPLDNERVIIGLDIPLADWGKTRARREIAQSNLELTQRRVDQARLNFEREVLIKVQQFDLIRDQVDIADRSLEVAQKKRELSRNRYLVGKVGVTDLNIAISEEINARRNYVNALRNFWLAYYELRRLTLYDFQRDRPLIRDGSSVIR